MSKLRVEVGWRISTRRPLALHERLLHDHLVLVAQEKASTELLLISCVRSADNYFAAARVATRLR